MQAELQLLDLVQSALGPLAQEAYQEFPEEYEPCCEKTCPWCLLPGKTQTSLYSYRS